MPRRVLSFFHRSVRGRLAVLVAAVLLPAIVLVSWLIFKSYRHERRALERHLIGAARATSLLVDATLVERQALLEGLATSDRLQRSDFAAFRDQAAAVVSGVDEWVSLIEPDGRQRVHTLMPFDEPLPDAVLPPEMREAFLKRQPYVSNLTFGQVSRRQIVFTSQPIFRGDQLRFVLNFGTTPKAFNEAMAKGGAAPGWLVTIVDREGRVIARSRRAEEFIGVKAGERMRETMARAREGVIESTTLDGIKSITAFTQSTKWGWTVIVASPSAELFASAEQLLLVAMWVSLVFGLGAVVVGWWASRGVVSAMRTLVDATESIGHGRVLRDGETGIAETDIVFGALKETSERLAARESELVRANLSLTSAAEALREKQERLDAARTAAATGTFVWHVGSGAFESDESLNTLLALPEGGTLRALGDFITLVHPEEQARVRETLEGCARQAGDFAAEFRVVRYDGATRWWSTKGKATRGVGGDYVAAGCVDVTERRRAEAEIAHARDAAVAAARAKDEFLAALSHELRTPLNPVLLVASDAAQHPDYPAAAREAFATIAKNAALEARLIDDLLDLTRVTQGKLSLDVKPVDVHAVLREALATVRAELEQKQQVLALELAATASTVEGDPTRLQQVFWNVLKNAVKFTPPQGRIGVASRDDEGGIEIQITDTGIGMTPPEIARSFETFSQGDHALGGSSHRFGGLGLGLAISRMLVELHAGRITAQSGGRGLGSTFCIHLPLAKRMSASHGMEPPATAAADVTCRGGGTRILLVEDHDATRSAVARLLGRRGYEVKAASTAAEAQRLAAEHRFDLVISDIGLPDADGYGLMKQLRDQHGLRGLALSGYGMEEDIARGLAAGFVEHLTKPIDIKKLEAVLARLLG